jgi:hypothetical protein
LINLKRIQIQEHILQNTEQKTKQVNKMSDKQPALVKRMIDKDQWFDPSLLLVGNGSEDWARWATYWLYYDVCSLKTLSEEWPKFGIITQFDRHLTFTIAAPVGTASIPLALPTNNRNWLLLSRAATATDANGNALALRNFDIRVEGPNNAQFIETQPISNVFGSGDWPHVMYFPEEWEQNVTRNFVITNNSLVAATIVLNLKFLQVRNP